MQVSTLNLRRYMAPCLVLGIVTLLFAAGCDRATPERVKAEIDKTQGASTEGSGAAQSGSNPAAPISGDTTGGIRLSSAEPATDPTSAAPTGKVPEISPVPQVESKPQFGQTPNPNGAAAQAAAGNGQTELPASARTIDQADLMNRTFMTLKPPTSNQPADLVGFLDQVDGALRDLIVAGTNNVVDAATFTSSGLRLGQMKLTAGEQLAALPDATAEQRKAGTIAQLVALSHMSGLKDVESAKKLERLATSLLQSSDADLAHQGRVVLLGFRLQELQNGAVSDPATLLADLEGLFQRPSDAGFPEMMVLQQSQQVLGEMGFKEAAAKIDTLMVSKFIDSPDPQLSMSAWSVAVATSQAFQNYNAALQDLYTGKETQPQMLLAAARGLFAELPKAATLLQFVNLSTDLEYRGMVPAAEEISRLVQQQSSTINESPFAKPIADALSAQTRRLSVRGQPLELTGLVDLDGRPLDWSAYKGKVVLIDFWATWCMPCLKELPNIRQVYSTYSDKGFEVLSINMDDDLTPVRQYLSSNPLPWKTVCSSDASALGFKSEIAQRLGITAIPFLVLVDADGKVAAVHVRGDRLGPTVQTMLSQ